jgi:hypothetical protein
VKLHGKDEAVRRGQNLLVTIGGHAGSSRKIGDVDFGPAAPFDEDETTLSWYDYLFKNVANDFSHPQPVSADLKGIHFSRFQGEPDGGLMSPTHTGALAAFGD